MPRTTKTLKHVPRLAWNAQEAAARLGVSVNTLLELREAHPLYRPDVMPHGDGRIRQATERGRRGRPAGRQSLWSDALLCFIVNRAWRLTPEGIRWYSDDDAWALWKQIQENEFDSDVIRAG